MPRYQVRGIVNSRAASTSDSTTRCSERDSGVMLHLVRIFLKMPKQSTFVSQDTELEQLPSMWDSTLPSYGIKQEKGLCMVDVMREIYRKLFF